MSAGTAPRWAAFAILLPLVLLLAGEELRGLGLAALIVGAIGVTFLWAPDRLNATDSLVHWALFGCAIVLGATMLDLRPLWLGIECGVAIAAVVALAQWMGWEALPQVAPPAGTFLNKNVMAEAAMLAFITAMLSGRARVWCYLFLAVVFATYCRAAYGGIILVAAAVFYRKQFHFAAVLVISMLAVLALAHLEGSGSGTERLQFWQMAMQSSELFGNGVGSFASDHPAIGKVHNEMIQSLYEFGIFALPLWGALFYVLKDGPANATELEWYVLAAIVGVSFLAFPFQLPLTVLAAGAAVGRLAERRGLLRLLQHARRSVAGEPREWRAEVSA